MGLTDKISPFQPESPVKPENFEGRKEIIDKNLPFLRQSASGRPTHFLIKGKRGMGKTSLAEFFNNIAEKEYKMVGVHVLNDGVHSINDLIHQIIERLLNEIRKETWSEKIFNKLKNNVKSAELFGIKLEFTHDEKVISNIKDNFAFFLKDIIDNFEDKNGLVIIIDDINGLSHNNEFVNWYKSFADTLSIEFGDTIPLSLILTTYPENAQILHEYNPSFTRLFKHITVEELTNSEIKDFFTKTFKKVNMALKREAVDLMVRYSSGLPNMMQEIGDGVFWMNGQNIINEKIAFNGIIRAGDQIGVKYLRHVLDTSIRSDEYLTIFKKLGSDFGKSAFDRDYSFKKQKMLEKLNDKESKVFTDFLKRARSLNILEFSGAKKSGHYKFTSNLFPIFFMIESLKEEH
ncbi:MAG: ATP-binding protein [Methanobrevibacter sp.]|nr:ATP-binding protein [Methanobrevibacter sp.]